MLVRGEEVSPFLSTSSSWQVPAELVGPICAHQDGALLAGQKGKGALESQNLLVSGVGL